MKLGKYDKKIFEILLTGTKNIYVIHKEITKTDKVDYAVIKRSVDRLAIHEFIVLSKIGIRNAKEYSIMLSGILAIYYITRGNKDILKFHRSDEGKRIVKKIIDFISEKIKIQDKEMEELFSNSIKVSPSFIEYFASLNVEELKPINLEDPDLFKEVIKSIMKNMKTKQIHFEAYIIKTEASIRKVSILSFLLKSLVKDFKKHPQDTEIRKAFITVLTKKCIANAHKEMRHDEEVINTFVCAIKEGKIKLEEPVEKQIEKLKSIVYSEDNPLKLQGMRIQVLPFDEPKIIF